MPPLTFTPLRISTLVITGHLGTMIHLDTLFNRIRAKLIPLGYPAEGFLKMEHGAKVLGASARDLLTKRRVSTKTFFNQSTLVIRKKLDGEDTFKEVNVKLFANGGFQMTGIPSEAFARATLEWMIRELPDGIGVAEEGAAPKPLRIAKFAIQLLNSDYKVNALIKREALHKILCEQYRLSSTLETTIYQGVNTKYYYNEEQGRGETAYPTPAALPGICNCPRFCNGQGDGTKIGACKKITIAAFQTGSIIITGARNQAQLDEAYAFMNAVLRRHESAVCKPLPGSEPSAV